MKRSLGFALLLLIAAVAFAQSTGRQKLAPDTPKGMILQMDPANVDPSDLPLDSVEQLHPTGTPQKIADISMWRLRVTGKAVGKGLSLSYTDLLALPMVKKRVLLICPGFFADYVEWEGVPLSAILDRAKARSPFAKVSFISFDGYSGDFSFPEATQHMLFLAVRVNGQTLPTADGYPVRLVAEDFYGARWTKWIAEIRIE